MKEVIISGKMFCRAIQTVKSIKDNLLLGEEILVHGQQVYQMKEILMSQGIVTVIQPKENDSFILKLKV